MSHSSATRIHKGSLIAHRAEVEALTPLHYAEVTTDKDLMVLAPDWDMFKATEDLGILHTQLAWSHGKLVGYSVNYFARHPHYDLKVLSNGSIFVHPDERGTTGLRLIDATEQMGRDLGAKLMLWHAKPDTPLSKLLARRKQTKVQDLLFSKRL